MSSNNKNRTRNKKPAARSGENRTGTQQQSGMAGMTHQFGANEAELGQIARSIVGLQKAFVGLIVATAQLPPGNWSLAANGKGLTCPAPRQATNTKQAAGA